GRISILGGGGTPPYDFRISNQGFIPENTFFNLPAGTYQVELRDAEGCAIGSTATITEPPLLTVDAGENRIVELGDQTLLEAISSEQPVTYLWSREEDLTCNNCPDPLALPLNSVTYTVSVTNNNGCIATDDVNITVSKPRRIYAPTAFSPNNDGTNDFFTIYGDKSTVQIVSLKIFDRWGELLFNGQELPLGEEALGWDGMHKGDLMNSGIYLYLAEIEFLDGEIVIEQGDLLLAR
ncbi:MAG: gliding motility-associated C-terminal domain-containing protein, partial [Bacteroidota bacterium]